MFKRTVPNTAYFQGLNSQQIENVSILMEEMQSGGIYNPFTKAAILAVISKESRFIPQGEIGYGNTSNGRIRTIFGSRVSHLSDSQLTALKSNKRQFFNTVYGGRYGNTAPDDGYKYRGRGYNQLTFKGNYSVYAKMIGVDIVSRPELLDNSRIAAKVAIAYFKRQFDKAPSAKKQEYNFTDINSFNSQQNALLAIYNSNAGWGKSKSRILSDPTGGLKKARSRVDGFYQWLT